MIVNNLEALSEGVGRVPFVMMNRNDNTPQNPIAQAR
jgi:hypothetical protein